VSACTYSFAWRLRQDIFWNIGICLQACEVSQSRRSWSEYSVLYISETSVRTWTSVRFTETFPTSIYILSLVQCMWELWTKWYWDRLFSEHVRSSAISCSVDWYFITDFSGQPLGPIFRSQGSGTAWPLKPYHLYSLTIHSVGQQNESQVVKFWKSTTGDLFCSPTVLECIICAPWRWPFKIWNMLDLCIVLKKCWFNNIWTYLSVFIWYSDTISLYYNQLDALFSQIPARKLSTNLYDIYHCWVYSE
jgi:hypothetical protein